MRERKTRGYEDLCKELEAARRSLQAAHQRINQLEAMKSITAPRKLAAAEKRIESMDAELQKCYANLQRYANKIVALGGNSA